MSAVVVAALASFVYYIMYIGQDIQDDVLFTKSRSKVILNTVGAFFGQSQYTQPRESSGKVKHFKVLYLFFRIFNFFIIFIAARFNLKKFFLILQIHLSLTSKSLFKIKKNRLKIKNACLK